jgi:hypothetical protein
MLLKSASVSNMYKICLVKITSKIERLNFQRGDPGFRNQKELFFKVEYATDIIVAIVEVDRHLYIK